MQPLALPLHPHSQSPAAQWDVRICNDVAVFGVVSSTLLVDVAAEAAAAGGGGGVCFCCHCGDYDCCCYRCHLPHHHHCHVDAAVEVAAECLRVLYRFYHHSLHQRSPAVATVCSANGTHQIRLSC